MEASDKTPLLVMFIRFDMPTVREVLSRDDIPEAKSSSQRQALAVGETTAGLLRACHRLLDVLPDPEDIPFLSPLIQREITYRLLKTPQADRLRAIATSGDPQPNNGKGDRLGSSQLRQAGAGRHRQNGCLYPALPIPLAHFHEPTAIPKLLRLQTARQRMLMDGLDGTTAALRHRASLH